MKLFRQALFGISLLSLAVVACNSDNKAEGIKSVTVKGLYSFGPEMKSFTLCDDGREFWVTDSVKELELAYSNLGFEKPYEPVYVELEGHYVKSDSAIISADYDSTLVVTKVLKISKEIPEGPCSQ